MSGERRGVLAGRALASAGVCGAALPAARPPPAPAVADAWSSAWTARSSRRRDGVAAAARPCGVGPALRASPPAPRWRSWSRCSARAGPASRCATTAHCDASPAQLRRSCSSTRSAARRNRGQNGWEYKVDGLAGRTGAADPERRRGQRAAAAARASGCCGSGVEAYAGGCQRTLEVAAAGCQRRAPGAAAGHRHRLRQRRPRRAGGRGDRHARLELRDAPAARRRATLIAPSRRGATRSAPRAPRPRARRSRRRSWCGEDGRGRLSWPRSALVLAARAAGCGLGAGPRADRRAAARHARLRRRRARTAARARRSPAQETVMSLLMRNAPVTTRYGGGFVQSIDGLAGGAAKAGSRSTGSTTSTASQAPQGRRRDERAPGRPHLVGPPRLEPDRRTCPPSSARSPSRS